MPRPTREELLAFVAAESERLRGRAARDLDAPVPTCPGWSAGDLVVHVGGVQRFHAAHLRRGTTDPPDRLPGEEPDRRDLLAWSARQTSALLAALRDVPDDLPAWNWAPHTPQVAAFWHRRMAMELLVHGHDAARATGGPVALDPVLATDAVDEVLVVLRPAERHWTAQDDAAGPDGADEPLASRGTALVRTADSGVSWLVEVGRDRWAVRREDDVSEPRRGGAVARSDAPEDVLLEADAERLCLALWGREALEPHVRGDVGLGRVLRVAGG